MLTPMRDLVPDKKKGIPRSAMLTGIVLGILGGLLIRSIVHGFFFYPYTIQNDRMFPGLRTGDKVTVDLRFETKDLERGDILLLRHPAYTDDHPRYIFARLIGLPNESIAIRNRMVYINGAPLHAPWERKIRKHLKYTKQPFTSPNQKRDQLSKVRLTKKQIFVLSDNRKIATDSRQFGPVGLSQIEGVVRKQ